MAAQYTSVLCLELFNRYSGRPTSDSITDASKYTRLAEAQNQVIADISARTPWVLYQKVAYASMPTLTPDATFQVFTFGNDVNGDPLFPEGKVFIYPSLNSIPDTPWVEGVDFISEGTQIRIPNNGTYAGTLYWRGIAPVLPISSSNQPSLIPPASRMLIVYKAVENFATEGNRNAALADRMHQLYWGIPQAGQIGEFPRWMMVLRTQFGQGGALAGVTGLQLAIAGTGGNPGPYSS